MNQKERGYSMVKVLVWLIIFGAAAWQGFQILNVHQVNWRVEDAFAGVARNMAAATEAEVRQKLPTLLKMQYIAHDDLPEEFYQNLDIKSGDGKVEISSRYQMTVWPLGRVENVDKDGTYAPDELAGMDILRDKTRLDFEFEPYAATP